MLTLLLVLVLLLLIVGGVGYGRRPVTNDAISALIWVLVILVAVGLVLRISGLWVWGPAGW